MAALQLLVQMFDTIPVKSSHTYIRMWLILPPPSRISKAAATDTDTYRAPLSKAPENGAPIISIHQKPTGECPLVAFGSLLQLKILIFFLALILCEFIQRLGRTQPVTVHRLADTFLKIVPANLQSPLRSSPHYRGTGAFTKLSAL